MLQQTLAVCAESALRDAESNSVSIVNIYEEISAQAFPIVIPKVSAVFFLERESNDATQHSAVVHITLDGNEIAQLPATRIDFHHGLVNRHIVVIQGLQIPSPGRLETFVTVGDQRFPSWDIVVKQSMPMAHSEPTLLQ